MQEIIKKCDICLKVVNNLEYFIHYGQNGSLGSFFTQGNKTKKGMLCLECHKKIDDFIQKLKKNE